MQVYKDAIRLWGEDAQINMIIEECAELIVAIRKWGRGRGEPVVLVDHVCQEIADVEIMIEQFRAMGYGEIVDRHKRLKLDRLSGRIAEAATTAADTAEKGGSA